MGKFAVIESMTRIKVGWHTFRIWRSEEVLRPAYDNSDLEKCVFECGNSAVDYIVNSLGAMPRVSAVEVVNDQGDGVVCYVEWP